MPASPGEWAPALRPQPLQPELQRAPKMALLPQVTRSTSVQPAKALHKEDYQDPGEELQDGDSNFCRATCRSPCDPEIQLEGQAAQVL
jgi:hypothetical protein